jgi:hypothetical protein
MCLFIHCFVQSVYDDKYANICKVKLISTQALFPIEHLKANAEKNSTQYTLNVFGFRHLRHRQKLQGVKTSSHGRHLVTRHSIEHTFIR